MEGLSRALSHALNNGSIYDIKVVEHLFISHLLLVDNIIIFSNGPRRDLLNIKSILDIFLDATSMVLNVRKSSYCVMNLSNEDSRYIQRIFIFLEANIQDGLRHLGFVLNPNDYTRID